MIKNKDKTVKKASRESVLDFLSRLSLFMAGWAAAVGVGVNATLAIDKQIRFRTYSNDLTPVSQMQENIDKMGLNSVIIDFENGRNARFMFPKNGKISVNVHIPQDELDQSKISFVNAIDEINEALTLVNPKFKLVLDFEPKDEGSLYSIDVYNGKTEGGVLAYWHDNFSLPTVNGIGVYQGKVVVDLSRFGKKGLGSTTALKTVLLHEIAGHGILRLGDAYKHLDEFTDQTIMKYGSTSNSPSISGSVEEVEKFFSSLASSTFSEYDLKVLMAKYAEGNDYIGWDKNIYCFVNTAKTYEVLRDEVKYIEENKDKILKNAVESFPELSGYNASKMVKSDMIYYSIQDTSTYNIFSLSSSGGKMYARDVNYDFGMVDKFSGTLDSIIVDGVIVNNKNYLYKYGDKVVEIECKTDVNGEKTAVVKNVYTSLTEEEFLQEKQNIENTYTNFKGSSIITDKAGKYLAEKGFEVKPIEQRTEIIDSEKGETIFLLNMCILVNKDGVQKAVTCKLHNGYLITLRGDVIANTNDGYKILDLKLDAKNLDATFTGYRDCQTKTPSKNRLKSDSRVK